jgi:hypothetical protein
VKDRTKDILTKLKKWDTQGVREISNGTMLICHVPHIAPKAWLHRIYAGLTDENIVFLQDKLGKTLPNDYACFLKVANGINIFSDSVSIWGMRTSNARRGDEAIQPYDLLSLNEEKIGEIPDSWLVFGSYSWDGSTMVYDLSRHKTKVFRCERYSINILQEWPDLLTWLDSEITRLSKLFDENGVEYDEDTPTIPT